jgi:hypothetical protein
MTYDPNYTEGAKITEIIAMIMLFFGLGLAIATEHKTFWIILAIVGGVWLYIQYKISRKRILLRRH